MNVTKLNTFSPWYVPLHSHPVRHQWEMIAAGPGQQAFHRCARCMMTRAETQRSGTESACDQILRLPALVALDFNEKGNNDGRE